MKKTLAAMLLLPTLAPVAQARPIDWQAELDRCRALREQTEPLLRAVRRIRLKDSFNPYSRPVARRIPLAELVRARTQENCGDAKRRATIWRPDIFLSLSRGSTH